MGLVSRSGIVPNIYGAVTHALPLVAGNPQERASLLIKDCVRSAVKEPGVPPNSTATGPFSSPRVHTAGVR
jgi:hypothetical protein